MKSEQLNPYLEVKQKTDRDVRQLGVLVSENYEAESTDGQIVINLNFSVDLSNKKQVWVFIDGQKLVEGSTSNYTFTNVVSNVSAQITLSAPLIAGLPIQVYKLGAYQESFPNPSSVTAILLNDVAQPHKMAQDAFQPFVKKTFVTAPNTQIVNRAQVEAASLKAIAGVERVMCKSISLSETEFGSNGEPVWELGSKDSRIRLVGAGWYTPSDTNGTRAYTVTVNDYAEITFYGTGLNILSSISNTSMDLRATIDGGTEGANFLPTSMSLILASRQYGTNQIFSVTSGLSLGWHTVKIRLVVNGFSLNGFEILNQRTDLAVLAGTAYAGTKQETLSSLSTSAFNAGVVGTRGARVVKYLKDGVISQVVQEVNAASASLTSTDHTNEEVVRRINFREFGANRSDDFSTLSTARDAAFTLDDGTTTLIGKGVRANAVVTGYIEPAIGAGSFLTITFVGTGLDLNINADASTRTGDIYVDSILQGTVTKIASTGQEVRKICSGLPYGTHTVKILQTSAPDSFAISDFIIYQPKKPSIPSGAIELCDYNVMANYTASSSASLGFVGTGLLRKQLSVRETTFIGTWGIATSVDATNFESGINNTTITSNSKYSYVFYGTGFEIRSFTQANAQNATLSVDGSTNLSSFTTSLLQSSSGATFTAATGVLGGTSAALNRIRIQVSGLALGWHTVTFTSNNTNNLYADSFDIITPIHINTNMKIGSLSLKDSRCFSPIIDKPEKIDLSKAKAWCYYDGVNQKILSSSNVSAVLRSAGGQYIVYFEKAFKNANYVVSGAASNLTRSTFISDAATGTLYRTPNFYYVYATGYDGTLLDSMVGLVFFGEQEDEGEI